jgi:hypothetical protein
MMASGILPKINPSMIGFLALMAAGGVLAWFLVPPPPPRKNSSAATAPGSKEAGIHPPGLFETLRKDSYILWLFPLTSGPATGSTPTNKTPMFNTRTHAPWGSGTGLRRFLARWHWVPSWTINVWHGASGPILFLLVNSIFGGGLRADLEVSRPSTAKRL